MHHSQKRQLAPEKKYWSCKALTKKDKVDLLLKDDAAKPKILKPGQRIELLVGVEKAYKAARKKADIAKNPKVDIESAGNLSMAELIKGIKEGWIVV